MCFQCVSKAWLVMISSPDFVKSHLDPHMKDEEDKLVKFSATDDDGSGAGENTPHGLSARIVYANISVHVNVTLNWSSSKMVGRDDWESKIVSFHLTTNSVVILSGPKPGRSGKHFHMRRWRRRLCLSDDEDDEDQEQRQ
nr:F-box/kelch-repeat protein At3g23880-like [Ipomoea trifida]